MPAHETTLAEMLGGGSMQHKRGSIPRMYTSSFNAINMAEKEAAAFIIWLCTFLFPAT